MFQIIYLINYPAFLQEPEIPLKTNILPPPYQKPIRGSVRPPLIPDINETEKQEEEEGFISNATLLSSMKSSLADICGIVFRRNPQKKHHQTSPQQWRHNSWPVQESFVIPDDDEPPPVETRTPTPAPRKTYAFMSQDPEKIHHLRQGQAYFNNWDGKMLLQQQKYQQQQQQQQVHQHRQYSSGPQTFYEHNCENTNEIVFGAVQEDRKRTMEIRAINYGDTYYDQYGVRSRIGSSCSSNGY